MVSVLGNCFLDTPEVRVPPTGFGIYKLPTFPQDIQNALMVHDSNLKNDGSKRRRILQVLFDDLQARVGL